MQFSWRRCRHESRSRVLPLLPLATEARQLHELLAGPRRVDQRSKRSSRTALSRTRRQRQEHGRDSRVRLAAEPPGRKRGAGVAAPSPLGCLVEGHSAGGVVARGGSEVSRPVEQLTTCKQVDARLRRPRIRGWLAALPRAMRRKGLERTQDWDGASAPFVSSTLRPVATDGPADGAASA